MYNRLMSICLSMIILLILLTQLRANKNKIRPLTVQLENGLKIICIHHSELPLIAIDLVLKKSSQHQIPNNPELVMFTAQLLLRGCRNRSYSQINKTLNSLGTNIDISITNNAIVYSCLVLRWDFEVVFTLLTDLVQYPIFEEDELFNLKQRLSNSFQGNSSYRLPTCSLNAAGFKNSKPLFDSITRKDVLRCYRRYFVPRQTEIRLTGDFSIQGGLNNMKKRLKLWSNTPGIKKRKKVRKLPFNQFVLSEYPSSLKRALDVNSGDNLFE